MIELTPENVQAIFIRSIDGKGETIEGVMSATPLLVSSDDAKLVSELLDQLPAEFHEKTGGGWSFLNACNNRDGQQWTGLHETMEKLVMLGLATGHVAFLMPRDMWSVLPGGMPYFVIRESQLPPKEPSDG